MKTPPTAVEQILRIPGLTQQDLTKASYHLRKRDGMCIKTGCPHAAELPTVRCVRHNEMNRRITMKYDKRKREE